MKKHHWGFIIFLVLMIIMLLGGMAIFITSAKNPQTLPPWLFLMRIPDLG